MIEQCISNNYFENLQLLSSEGRESNIYLVPNTYGIPMCIKKYDSSFWSACSNDEALKKIFLLYEKLENTKNISPCLVFYDISEYRKGNKKLIAIGIPFLQGYISIDNVNNINNKFICIRNLATLLTFFVSLGIYPTDLNSSNIMVSPDFDIQLIDLDGNHCKVDPENSSGFYKQIFNSLRYRILTDLMLDEDEYNAAYKYSSLIEGQRTILRQKGYDLNTINIILEEQDNPKLDTLLEVLNKIEPFFTEIKHKK